MADESEKKPKPAPAPPPRPAPKPAPRPVSAKTQKPKPVAAKAPTAATNLVPKASSGSDPVSVISSTPVEPVTDNVDPVEEVGEGSSRFLLLAAMPSWLVSLVVHLIIILLLALSYLPSLPVFNTDLTIGRPDVVENELTNFEETSASEMSVDMPSDVAVEDVPEIQTDDPALVDDPTELEAATMTVELSDVGFEANESTDLMQEIGSFTGSGLAGRSAAERTRLVREAGGTEGSEQAVKRALLWIARHQSPDGGWNFHHLGGRCACKGHGSMAEARIGATALALLPYLGAGNTHLSGNYKEVVAKGLYFLKNSQKGNGSLHEPGGRMYSHGLAAIVLCEAYAMTGDKNLLPNAQASLNFISYAQDPKTRGWRYDIRDLGGGDTSVVGWQLMALKSGHMSGLQVNNSTVVGTSRFLDSVQANGGATYGYMAPGEKNATTAVGLLCRMYLGWEHDHPPLIQGVKKLSKAGPSKVNLYYNYYATQVMRHYGGEPWDEWNEEMRDYLVEKQYRKGHAEGSWYLGKEHTDKGGRLYCTALSTMILEVYYRHLPIYGKKASDEDFEL